MIKASHSYITREVFPRWKTILIASDFWIAVIIGISVGLWGDCISLGSSKIASGAVAILTYAAIALGFCLAGLTLTLTLPNSDFVKKLATTTPPKSKTNSYSNLLFVFSWTAILHWILVVISVLALVFFDSDAQLLLNSATAVRRIIVGLTFFYISYGLFHFLITLITLSQVGSVYIKIIEKQ